MRLITFVLSGVLLIIQCRQLVSLITTRPTAIVEQIKLQEKTLSEIKTRFEEEVDAKVQEAARQSGVDVVPVPVRVKYRYYGKLPDEIHIDFRLEVEYKSRSTEMENKKQIDN